MIKAIIAESDGNKLIAIKKIIEDHCPQIHLVGDAINAQSIQELICKLDPELLITEISFSDGDIFSMLDNLMPLKFEIIFLSADDAHSLKAFKYNALDYLIKPISVIEIQLAIRKSIKKIWDNRVNDQLRVLINNIQHISSDNHKIAVATIEGYVFVQVSEIVRCEANGAYTILFLNNKEKILASKNIKEYENLLPKKYFFRIHNSHLVNLNKVVKYNKGRGGNIVLEDGTQIEVASRRKDKFLSMFQ